MEDKCVECTTLPFKQRCRIFFRLYRAESKLRERKAAKDKKILTRQITNQDRSTYYNILCSDCKDEKKR